MRILNHRGTSAPTGRQESVDRLPPHDDTAEQGILGCCLLNPKECVAECREWFEGEDPFYDLRHGNLFHAMTVVLEAGQALDLITLQRRLKDDGKLDQCGGLPYILTLPDKVPSAANLKYYLEIVWEKFLARRWLQDQRELATTVLDLNGVTEPWLAKVSRVNEEFQKRVQRGNVTPQFLKPASAFQEDYFARFFGAKKGVPGIELPIGFPLKIRRKEMSLVSGDDGAGKSTLLGYFMLHIAAAGEKAVVASLETPPDVTLWIMAAQLLGTKELPDSTDGHKKAADALAWLNRNFWFYDFTGIADWKDVLDTLRYAVQQHGVSVALIDSVMRLGIPDDDYAMQGLVAARMAQFAKDQDAHLFVVHHENKGSEGGKSKVRGSKLWTANMDNVMRVKLNHDKEEKASRLRGEIQAEKFSTSPDNSEIAQMEKDLEKLRREWDTELVLQKQRFPGTRQNGSRRFWFDSNSFQFRDKWEEMPVNWLDRWKKKKEATA